MKYADIQKMHEVGLITDEQRQKIVNHFQLKEDGGGKFLAIVSMIGAVLITTGIILLISAHWNEIPRGAKIAGGLALMLGFHAGGWWLRCKRRCPHSAVCWRTHLGNHAAQHDPEYHGWRADGSDLRN